MAKKAKIEEIPKVSKDEREDMLANDILDIINKKFKGVNNALGYLGNANLVDTYVSTGSAMLDLAISNRAFGGLGFGIMCEIFGPSASSKSLLAAHILAETQKMGGLAVLFDTENAVGMLDFYKSIGLKVETALYSDKIRDLESIFLTIESIIERSLVINKDRPITICIDSIMGATTLAELEDDYEKGGWATAKSIILSKAMRKITSLLVGRKILIVFINQVRTNLGITFGTNHTTSGGMAIGFHSSVRLKTKAGKKIVVDDMEIGSEVQVTVIKNRLGPPGRSALFNIYYESGIDDYGSWLNTLKDFGILKLNGAWYSYEYIDSDSGEIVVKKFQSKDFKKLLEQTPGLKDIIYDQICEAYIMRYKIDEPPGIDDVQYGDEIHETE